jgi:CHAT domain-containing protein
MRPMLGFANPLLEGPQNDVKYGAFYKKLAAAAKATVGCAPTRQMTSAALRHTGGSTASIPVQRGLTNLGDLKVQVPLPETADEICAVARDLDADLDEMRLGARATEREVKALSASGKLKQYRLIHFATHAALAGELKGTAEPGLILTPPEPKATQDDDGYLSGSEIASLKLDADWIILSACNTAGSDDASGTEALSGLARAFFYAGARALLASHWAVDSDATVQLVTIAARESRDKAVGRAEALRRAMLSMIKKGTQREAHPTYWAPFVIIGEGGAGR